MWSDVMEGYPRKLDNDMSSYTYTATSQSHVAPPPPGPITHTPFIPHPSTQTEKDLGMTPGTSVQEDRVEGNMTVNTGRKKKKKNKSGDDSSAKPTIMSEEEFVDAAIPVLSENQGGAGVEELVVGSTVPPPPPEGIVIGGQYVLNNALLDHILTEKKMQLLQSPEVMEYLKKQMSEK